MQLSGCLGYVQVVLKKLVDSCGCFFIKCIWDIAAKNLFQEVFTNAHRELVDQPSDTKLVVRKYSLFGVKELSYAQCQAGLLKSTGQLQQITDTSAVCDLDVSQCLHVQCVDDHMCNLVDIFDRV